MLPDQKLDRDDRAAGAKLKTNVTNSFGSLAILPSKTHGFASRPHGRFAFIVELCLSSVSCAELQKLDELSK